MACRPEIAYLPPCWARFAGVVLVIPGEPRDQVSDGRSRAGVPVHFDSAQADCVAALLERDSGRAVVLASSEATNSFQADLIVADLAVLRAQNQTPVDDSPQDDPSEDCRFPIAEQVHWVVVDPLHDSPGHCKASPLASRVQSRGR